MSLPVPWEMMFDHHCQLSSLERGARIIDNNYSAGESLDFSRFHGNNVNYGSRDSHFPDTQFLISLLCVHRALEWELLLNRAKPLYSHHRRRRAPLLGHAMSLFILILLLASLSPSLAAEPEASLRAKNVEFNGNLGFTVAEFGLTFDQDLVYQAPANCPAGRHPVETTPAYLETNPCAFMACHFTLKGPECGKARLPECEAICASQRPTFCPAIQDWIVLTLNQESEPVRLSNREEPVLFRVNFNQPLRSEEHTSELH